MEVKTSVKIEGIQVRQNDVWMDENCISVVLGFNNDNVLFVVDGNEPECCRFEHWFCDGNRLIKRDGKEIISYKEPTTNTHSHSVEVRDKPNAVWKPCNLYGVLEEDNKKRFITDKGVFTYCREKLSNEF